MKKRNSNFEEDNPITYQKSKHHFYIKGDGENMRKKSCLQKEQAYGKQSDPKNVNSEGSRFKVKICSRNSFLLRNPPIMHSNTKSDPLGLKHTLFQKTLELKTQRQKRYDTLSARKTDVNISSSAPSMFHLLSNKNRIVKNPSTSNFNRKALGKKITNDRCKIPIHCEINKVSNFDDKYHQKQVSNKVKACKLINVEKRFGRANKGDSICSKRNSQEDILKTVMVYKGVEHTDLRNESKPFINLEQNTNSSENRDEINSEACSTFYASSSDYNFYLSKNANILKQRKRIINSMRNKMKNLEPSVNQDFSILRYLEDKKKLDSFPGQDVYNYSSDSTSLKEKISVRNKNKKLKRERTKFQLRPKAMSSNRHKRQSLRNPRVLRNFNSCQVPEIDFQYSENYRKSALVPKCDNHPKVVNHTRNSDEHFHKNVRHKVTDEELWKRFKKMFKRYATSKLYSGAVIPHKFSTFWMKDAGIVDEFMTDFEADAFFKEAVGVKITMNIHEFRDFLFNLSIKKKLPFHEIYRRMCGL